MKRAIAVTIFAAILSAQAFAAPAPKKPVFIDCTESSDTGCCATTYAYITTSTTEMSPDELYVYGRDVKESYTHGPLLISCRDKDGKVSGCEVTKGHTLDEVMQAIADGLEGK